MPVEHHEGFVQNVVGWLHDGYPQGVPRKDYFPLLALLMRSLSEEELVRVARTIVRETDVDTPVTEQQIRDAIHEVTEKEPNIEEMRQVAARLASVGWPLEDGR